MDKDGKGAKKCGSSNSEAVPQISKIIYPSGVAVDPENFSPDVISVYTSPEGKMLLAYKNLIHSMGGWPIATCTSL